MGQCLPFLTVCKRTTTPEAGAFCPHILGEDTCKSASPEDDFCVLQQMIVVRKMALHGNSDTCKNKGVVYDSALKKKVDTID